MSQDQILGAPSQTNAAVIGGGTMGADVAVVLLRAQCKVTVVETATDRHPRIRDHIQANLQAIDMQEQIDKLSLVGSLDEVDWAQTALMIECIPEVLELKQQLYADLVRKTPENTVLASNSSSFPISQIAEGLETRHRMVGLHFFMPAHIVPLVEVVLAQETAKPFAEGLANFMRRCGCVPIMVRKDVPGFIANRLQHALGREAFSLIQEGIATPEDIDAAVRFGFGFRYLAAGPVMQKEHAGIDVHAAAAATIYPSLSNTAIPPDVLAEKPRNGDIGMKSGKGFYEWTDETIKVEKERYNRVLREGLKLLAEDLPKIDP